MTVILFTLCTFWVKKAALNCRKYNTTFHQGLRTFQRKGLHFGNEQNHKKTLITIKLVCFVLLKYFFANSVGRLSQAFKWALLFLIFILFPTFLICSYFSLLFHENALLSLLFHSKMSLLRKNPEFFLARFAHSSFINELYVHSGDAPFTLQLSDV